jgi:hypothetical protein
MFDKTEGTNNRALNRRDSKLGRLMLVEKILLTALANEEEKIPEDGKCDNGNDQHVVAKKFNVAETVIHFFLNYF